MSPPLIAYGRISTNLQVKEQLAQTSKIINKFCPTAYEFGFDIGTGDSDPFGRSMFPAQYDRAKALGVPLTVEHPDRLLKSYGSGLIVDFYGRLEGEKTELRFAMDNTAFHGPIISALSGNFSSDWKRRQLINLIEAHTRWRHKNILSREAISKPVSAVRYESLQSAGHFRILEECAQAILSLERSLNHPSLFGTFLDAYLGMAYNLKYKHYLAMGKRRSIPRGQHSYLDDPEHVQLFRRIHVLDSTPMTKLDGTPKRPSCQWIADRLNSEARFTNIHGDAFNRKSIHRIRSSEAYRILIGGSSTLPR